MLTKLLANPLGVCIGMLGVGYVLFAANVSRQRFVIIPLLDLTPSQKCKISMGTGTQLPGEPLFNAVRAHGNYAEYAPLLAGLVCILGHNFIY